MGPKESKFFQSGIKLSLNQLMQEENRNRLNEQIFQIDQRLSVHSPYKFVMIKVNEIVEDESESRTTLIQLIDMSDKILYDEQQTEQSFLTLINAAISHKLRSPLNSLIGQMESMKSYFTTFSIVLSSLKQEQAISEEVASKLERVFGGIKERGFKIFRQQSRLTSFFTIFMTTWI